MYSFVSQPVVTLYLYSSAGLRCRECSFPKYLPPKSSKKCGINWATVVCPWYRGLVWGVASIRFQVLDLGTMWNFSCLWESMHPLSYLYEDLSSATLVLGVVLVYKFLWDHGYLHHYLLYSIFLIVQATYFTSMHMYFDLMSEMALLTCIFIVVKYNVCVLNSPGYSISFPPAVSLVLRVSVFCGLVSHIYCPSVFWFVFV